MLIIDEVGNVHNRIDQLVDHFCKGNKAAFGRAADIQSGVLAGIIGGRKNKPSFDVLQKLLTAYPTVNPTWLLFGRGPMLQGNNVELIAATPSLAATLPTESLEAMVKKIVATQLASGQQSVHYAVTREKEIDELINKEASLIEKLDEIAVEGRALRGRVKNKEFEDKLEQLEGEYRWLDTEYKSAFLLRIKLEEIQQSVNQEAQSIVYTTQGEPDASKVFGGLLQYRLNISEAAALQLIKAGKLRAAAIEGEGYRVSEMAVREFLGEA